MLKIDIPGYGRLELTHLVMDYNGTIARDGKILPELLEPLAALAKDLRLFVLTADTHGTAAADCGATGLPIQIMTFPSDKAAASKLEIIRGLGTEGVCAVGNGRNDLPMLSEAGLSIAVCGPEGCYGKLAGTAEVLCGSMEEALLLLTRPERLIATLRG